MEEFKEANKSFQTIGSLNSLWQPISLGLNVVKGNAYRYDGASRSFDQPHTIFQYTVEGEGEVIYKGESYKVPEGSGFFCNSHDPDVIYQFPENSPKWYIMYITFLNIEEMCAECCEKYGPVFKLTENNPLLAELYRLVQSRGNHISLKKHQSVELVSLVLSNVLNSFELSNEKKMGTIIVSKVCQYINLNINEPLSVDIVASAVGVSREHLSRLFKAEENVTLARYIRLLKIREATRLFSSGMISVKEVSLKLGFGNTSSFIRTFKNEIGITPGQFLSDLFG